MHLMTGKSLCIIIVMEICILESSGYLMIALHQQLTIDKLAYEPGSLVFLLDENKLVLKNTASEWVELEQVFIMVGLINHLASRTFLYTRVK